METTALALIDLLASVIIAICILLVCNEILKLRIESMKTDSRTKKVCEDTHPVWTYYNKTTTIEGDQNENKDQSENTELENIEFLLEAWKTEFNTGDHGLKSANCLRAIKILNDEIDRIKKKNNAAKK